jgi:ankyrin repeat protein
MQAAASGDVASVHALIAQGTEINEQLKLIDKPGIRVSLHGLPYLPHGETALMIAIERSKVDVVQLLLEHGASTSAVRSDEWRGTWDAIPFRPFRRDEKTSDLRMLQMLLKHADRPLPPDKAYETLGRAVNAGDIASMALLKPFVIAAYGNDREKMAALYCRALGAGAIGDDRQTIAVLEDLQSFAGNVSSIPFNCAMGVDTTGTLRYLLDRGMDPNRQGENGMRPLSYQLIGLELEPFHGQRLSKKKRDLLVLLLKYGADPRLSEAPNPSAIDRARLIASPELDELFNE